VSLPVDIECLIPLLAEVVPKYRYEEENRLLVFQTEGVFVRIESKSLSISGVSDEKQARQIFDRINRMITDIATRTRTRFRDT
jgi:ArsR family metal-binding transcriptional regulator